jgi:deoxyadenosine/deoxycytidine kinase
MTDNHASPNHPIYVVVDAIIGAGKTTIIRHCLIPYLTNKGWRVTEIKEPVDKWKNSGRLQQFYADPSRRGFQFQTRAFHDRIRECQDKYNKYKDVTDVFILERSVFTDLLFIKCLYEANTIDLSEYEDIMDLWSMWAELMPFKPDLFIYLKPTVEVCMQRLRERNRDGEAGVSEEYQRDLQQKHDDFLGDDFVAISDCKYVPRLLLETDSNFRDDENVRTKICTDIEAEFNRIRNNKMRQSPRSPLKLRAQHSGNIGEI